MMLLIPSKNTNPDLTIVATSAVLIKHLRKNRFETMGELRNILKQYNKDSSALLEHTLEFLFLLGLVEYHSKNDLVEYIKNETF